MGEDTLALDKAIESGDTDLVYFVLLSLKKNLPLAHFFRVINTRPVASALVESSARSQDLELLKDLYYQDDRRLDGANLLLSEAITEHEAAKRNDKLKNASKLLSDTKEFSLHRSFIDEIPKLLKHQQTFEQDFQPEKFAGLSVNETMFKLIRLGAIKRAQKIQSEFKVPERLFWWVRLRALVAKRDWTELEEISKQKRSPIGWEPFFNEVLGAGNSRVASLFVPKCTGLQPRERIEMYVKCGLVGKAAEEALKARDKEALIELRTKASGREAQEVERAIKMLEGGKK
jgi:hypothetical protein